MRRIRSILILVVLAIVALPATANAITVADIALGLKRGYVYVAPGMKGKVDRKALQTSAKKNLGYRYVVLKTLPRGSGGTPTALSRKLLARLPKTGAKRIVYVSVITEDGRLGATHRTVKRAVIDDAVLTVKDTAKTDPEGTLDELTTIVVANKPVAAPTGSSGAETGAASGASTSATASTSSGRPWWIYLIIAVVGLGLVLAFLRHRSSKGASARRRGGSTATARSFHQDRLEELAGQHAALSAEVADLPEGNPAIEHHQTAGSKLVTLRRQLAAIYAPRELRTAAMELDQVEWNLAACEAAIAGAPEPPQPGAGRNGLCFFTHEHGLGTHEVDLRRPDGTTATVWVCEGNYLALTNGEQPLVSNVNVGSRSVPWPAAPTWYGAPGWNLEELPGLEFEGREIWGADPPRRATPLPASDGVRTYDSIHDDLPPGVEQPPSDLPVAAPPNALIGAYEELDEGPIQGLVEDPGVDTSPGAGILNPPATSAHSGEPTVTYDPFADEDLTREAWEPRQPGDEPWDADADKPR